MCMDDQTTTSESPWHDGERALHERYGVTDKMKQIGTSFIRDYLIEEHRLFYKQLPFIVVGSVDDAGLPWASIVEGKPGFLQSPTIHQLDINAVLQEGDPATDKLAVGDGVALLGIELHTRRRNRMNGVVSAVNSSTGFSVSVQHSFGNCPQYIQLRSYRFSRDLATPDQGERSVAYELDESAASLIEQADTFFVSTYTSVDDVHQVDVSHRGGKPGFVKVDEKGVLTIPDYAGNRFFNTLGNIVSNPKAGLVFADFETGDVLQISGSAEIVFDSPEIEAFKGADRLWRVTPERVVRRNDALALRWSFEEYSPYLSRTGSWDDVR